MSDKQNVVNTCTTLLSEKIDTEECEELTSVFQLQRLDAGEILLSEDEHDDALYIIMEGDIIVTRNAGGDEYVTLDHLKPGDIAGAMGFIDGKKHSATLRAVKDAHVLVLKHDELEAMLEDHPKLVYKIMKMIVRSVHKTLVRMNRQFVEMNNYIMKEHGRY